MTAKKKRAKGKKSKTKRKLRLGEKHKKGNRKKLADEIERAFTAYAQRRSCRDVKALLGWSKQTIERYRISGKWDKRCKQIDKKVNKSTDNKVKRRRVRNITVLDLAIDGIEERLKDKTAVFPIDKLGQVVKVQNELLGQGGFEDEEQVVTEEVKVALKILSSLDDTALKALGDEIASGNFDLVEAQ